MYLPPLQPVSHSDLYVCGDVDIHPSAAIAAGVILKAAPNSRIVIGEGVCLGMGAILNACSGVIEIENGAVLGAGVLIIGQGKIGHHACIGSATTIFNASVQSMAAIAGGSLIGDVSRQVEILSDPDRESSHFSSEKREPKIERKISSTSTEIVTDEKSSSDSETSQEELEDRAQPAEKVETKAAEEKEKTPIVGKIYINQLLVTLFPQNQNLNRPNPNDKLI